MPTRTLIGLAVVAAIVLACPPSAARGRAELTPFLVPARLVNRKMPPGSPAVSEGGWQRLA